MANVEQGQMTASSSFSKTPQPQVEPRPALSTNQSAPEGEVFYTTTAIGLVQKLTNLCGTKQGQEVESLALGHIALIPEQATRELLPVVIEWMRSPRNIGCEGLALSLLSATQAYFPGLYQPALAALASVSNSAYKAGPRLMVDLSASNRVLLSYFLSSQFASIVEALLTDPTVNVGMLVRKIGATDRSLTGFEAAPADPTMVDRINPGGGGGFNTCVGVMTILGAVGGGIQTGGPFIAAGAVTPIPGATVVGGVAGVLASIPGAMSGAETGEKYGKLVCGRFFGSGIRETIPSSINGAAPIDEGLTGIVGDWCWTIPGIPRPGFPIPLPRPIPRPFPESPIFGPVPLPETTPGSRLNGGIKGLTETAEAPPVRPTVMIGERLSPNLCLVHL